MVATGLDANFVFYFIFQFFFSEDVIITPENPCHMLLTRNSGSNDHASSWPWAPLAQVLLSGTTAKGPQRTLTLLSHFTDWETEARGARNQVASAPGGSRSDHTGLGGGDSHAGARPLRKEHSSHRLWFGTEHTHPSEHPAAWAGAQGGFHTAFPRDLAEWHTIIPQW